jgi:hypothetical protein
VGESWSSLRINHATSFDLVKIFHNKIKMVETTEHEKQLLKQVSGVPDEFKQAPHGTTA